MEAIGLWTELGFKVGMGMMQIGAGLRMTYD